MKSSKISGETPKEEVKVRAFKGLDVVERFVYESSLLKFLGTIAVLSLVRVGIWAIPNIQIQLLIAQHPFSNPLTDPNQNYLLWNWLSPLFAKLIHATNIDRFFLLHLIFSIAFTAGFIKILLQRLDRRNSRTAIVLFFLFPASVTSFFWVGYDSCTLLLMMLAIAVARFNYWPLFVGVLLGMQHFEQSFCAALALLLALILGGNPEQPLGKKWTILVLLGVVLGKLLLRFIFLKHHIDASSGRVYWLTTFFTVMLKQFWFHMHYILWSALGLGWVLVFKSLDDGKKALPYLIPLFALLLLLPISGDQTRVFAVTSFLLISVYWILNPKFLDELDGKIVAGLFLLSNAMPLAWVWGGQPRWSSFPYDVTLVLHSFFGWFSVPDLQFWPF
jgi:hypothetical protein